MSRSYCRRGNRQTHAFTLVELLVVVGIIAVLIAILLPVLKRARLAAQQTQCLSQMKNLGHALCMYVAETRGFIPHQNVADCAYFYEPEHTAPPSGGLNLLLTLSPYIAEDRRIFVCPVAIDEFYNAAQVPTALSDTNYMGNHAVTDAWKITRIKRSSEIILLQENRYRSHYFWLRPYGSDYTNASNSRTSRVMSAIGPGSWRVCSIMRAPTAATSLRSSFC